MRIAALVFCLSLLSSSLYSQEKKPIQLHGIVVSNDSLKQLLDELRQRAAAMGYDASEMQDYLITMQNQQLYNEGRVYGNGMNATGASAILGALSNPFAWQQLFQSLKR